VLYSTVVVSDGNVIMFDCGDGVYRQMLYNLNTEKVKTILISKLSPERILGLPSFMIQLFSREDREEFESYGDMIFICGPIGIRDFMYHSLYNHKKILNYLIFLEIDMERDNNEDELILIEETPQHKVECIPLLNSLCYIFSEKDRPGTINVDVLKQAGIMPGPIYQDIKYKNFTPKGLQREDIISPTEIGRRMAIIRDNDTVNMSIKNKIQGCQTIIYETPSLDSRPKSSSVSKKQNENDMNPFKLASAINSKNLILTNLMNYQDLSPPNLSHFDGNLYLANSDMTFEFLRNYDVKVVT